MAGHRGWMPQRHRVAGRAGVGGVFCGVQAGGTNDK